MTRVSRRAAWLLVLVVLALSAALGFVSAGAPPDLDRWQVAIEAAADEFGLDPHLLRALVAAESGGDERAVSSAGAVGLAQLMPPTAAEQAARLGIEDYDEARLVEGPLNLRLGAAYLARLLQRFDGEVAFALAAYNAGPSRVVRWREEAPDASPAEVIRREGFRETRRHLRRVLRFWEAYRGDA